MLVFFPLTTDQRLLENFLQDSFLSKDEIIKPHAAVCISSRNMQGKTFVKKK